jgi:hypothetical protein
MSSSPNATYPAPPLPIVRDVVNAPKYNKLPLVEASNIPKCVTAPQFPLAIAVSVFALLEVAPLEALPNAISVRE